MARQGTQVRRRKKKTRPSLSIHLWTPIPDTTPLLSLLAVLLLLPFEPQNRIRRKIEIPMQTVIVNIGSGIKRLAARCRGRFRRRRTFAGDRMGRGRGVAGGGGKRVEKRKDAGRGRGRVRETKRESG